MKVHLVGGFTGSGKTTAIEMAREILSEENIVTAVFGDKEEEYFLADCPKNNVDDFGDSADYDAESPSRVIGCFCCNYTQLDTEIEKLKKRSDQSVLFADYGGTCTNLISTLLNPVRDYRGADIELANFSTFVDAKLLLYHLRGMRVPLSLESKYTWDRHLEEAEILVINKTDLLPSEDLEDLRKLAKAALSSKQLLFQNSLDRDSIRKWIELISTKGAKTKKKEDSSTESAVAWLDEEIQIKTHDDTAIMVAYDFMHHLSNEFSRKQLPVEHLKFLLYDDNQALKFHHTQFINEGNFHRDFEKSDTADLMINARICASPNELRQILFGILNQFKSREGVIIKEKFISYFSE